MSRFSTLDPPPLIYYANAPELPSVTNTASRRSLFEERIRSAFESTQRELGRYQQYPAGWDGYNAEPFDSEVLNSVSGILLYSEAVFLGCGTMPDLVTTGPASDGSIDVEFQVADRRVLMTLYPHEDKLRLSSFRAKEAHDYVAPLGTETLAKWIDWLHHPDSLSPALDQDHVGAR